MSPFIVATIAIAIIVLALYALGVWCGVWPGPSELFGKEPPTSYPDDEYYDEYEQRCEGLLPEPEKAAEITVSADPFYGPPTFAEADLMLRLRAPRLFDNTSFVPECRTNWYEETRREFSQTVVRWAVERARFREAMGLAT